MENNDNSLDIYRFPLNNIPTPAGVYAIFNKKRGYFYIAESDDMTNDFRFHLRLLQHGKHYCKALQEDFYTYGINAFSFTVLVCGPEYQDDERMRDEILQQFIYDLPLSYNTTIFPNRYLGSMSTYKPAGRSIYIPPYSTPDGSEYSGGIFPSLADAASEIGISQEEIRRRVEDPKYPDWKEIGPIFESSEDDKLAQSREENRMKNYTIRRIFPKGTCNFRLNDIPTPAGVYAITQQETGRVYIGESENIKETIRFHLRLLREGKHYCKALQEDFYTYGIHTLGYQILVSGQLYRDEELARFLLEQEYIEDLPSDKCYNKICYIDEISFGEGYDDAGPLSIAILTFKPDDRLIYIPPYSTPDEGGRFGGIFNNLAEAERTTGMSQDEIIRRLKDPKYPDWKEIGPSFASPECEY